ncbi:MAG: GTP-binding protein [Candidatus Heimdallarchaeota archaeon]|nr:GTP-binding protein [Candidatus Heimdallarchaeota archaeon]
MEVSVCLVKFIPTKQVKPLKIIVLGEGGVGKTTISKTFTSNSCFKDARQTIAVEFHSIIFNLDSTKFKLQIWDLGGQEQFKNMGVFGDFCRGADAAILCFDLTDLSTLFSIPDWLKFIENDTPKFLVGTKYDLASTEEKTFDITSFEEKFHCVDSYICSSKEISSVIQIFKGVIDFLENGKNSLQLPSKTSVKISKPLVLSQGELYAKINR